jgi:rhodanese-related sulfurtransferase
MTSLKAFFIASALAVASFVPSAMAQTAPAAQVPLIEPAQVRGLLSLGGKITVVDVRTQAEWDQGHINGAILIPLDKLSDTYSKLPKTGKLIVYCRSGHRSGQAVQFLIAHGYTNAVSMNGGFIAWSQK